MIFMTEDQHKNLECPNTFQWVQEASGWVLKKEKCSGSACGAWRSDTNPQNETYGHGYCGDFGIPQTY